MTPEEAALSRTLSLIEERYGEDWADAMSYAHTLIRDPMKEDVGERMPTDQETAQEFGWWSSIDFARAVLHGMGTTWIEEELEAMKTGRRRK